MKTYKISRSILIGTATFMGACAFLGGSVSPIPAPAPAVAHIQVSAAVINGDSTKFTLTCVVPAADAGGAIESCKWGPIQRNNGSGSALLTVLSAFQAVVAIATPPVGQGTFFQESAQSVRRGLYSTPTTIVWNYSTPDGPPSVPAITITIDTIQHTGN